MTNMRTIQEIFNVVIEAGLYGKGDFMCFSLGRAEDAGLISPLESSMTIRVIDHYLSTGVGSNTLITGVGSNTLISSLISSGNLTKEEIGKSYTEVDLTRIFKDWANRPSLTVIRN